MRFKKPPRFSSVTDSRQFDAEMFHWATSITQGLNRLTFKENFISFIVEDITIGAGNTADVPNELARIYPGQIPSYRMILRQTGNGLITDGDWDVQFLRLINNGAVDVTATVAFFR